MEKYGVLEKLVAFDTIKDRENKEILDYLESELIKLGFKTEIKTRVLVMRIENNYQFGFLGHTDTVEYIEEFKNPFALTLKNKMLYGLGVCDMKGGIAAIIEALKRIDLTKLKHGIKLYFTYDEEIGFGGINELLSYNTKFPNLMVFGEPTDNASLTGSKGLLEYEIHFNGIKAHSSNPLKGKSANMNAVKFISELDDFYNNNIKNDLEAAFDIPYTTMNVGIINGGSAKNSVSAHCQITVDFRIAKKNHIKEIKKIINKLSKKYDASVIITECLEPFVNKIDFLNEIKTANFITEASKVHGVKKIILGPGPVTAHEVNEHISEESFEKLINQYIELIKKTCM